MILPEELEVVGFLKNLSPAHANQLTLLAQLREYPAGTVLFQEGRASPFIYFVLRGSVSLEMAVPPRGPMMIQTLGEGELLGWSPLLGTGPMTATARTATLCRLASLDVARLLELCKSDPALGMAVFRQLAVTLAQRLQATRARLLEKTAE